MKIKSNATNKK